MHVCVQRRKGKNWVDGGQEWEGVRLFILNIKFKNTHSYFLTMGLYYLSKILQTLLGGNFYMQASLQDSH